KQERPFFLFGSISLALFCLSLVLGYPVIVEYMRSHSVPRFPTAVLATGTMILASLSLFSGLILDTVTRGRKEVKLLHYLQCSSVHAAAIRSTRAIDTNGIGR